VKVSALDSGLLDPHLVEERAPLLTRTGGGSSIRDRGLPKPLKGAQRFLAQTALGARTEARAKRRVLLLNPLVSRQSRA